MVAEHTDDEGSGDGSVIKNGDEDCAGNVWKAESMGVRG